MKRPLLIALCVASFGACHVYTEPEPVYGTAEVSAAPVDIDVETYPHTVYAGRPVYYYQNRWYYRSGGGRWYYYREEPRPLYEYRQRGYVQQAPPAPRYNAPPPAVRVQ